MAFLRNPLAWYKRYVEEVYDTPSSPSSVIGRAGHVALQHFYGGIGKDGAIELGREYMRLVPDFEINFGKTTSRRAKIKKRQEMEREYERAVSFYLAHPPRHNVVGVEVKGIACVDGLPLPLKAVSDLVVKSRIQPGALDIVDHKFVEAFTPRGAYKSLFVIQALFNYYTVRDVYKKPVRRFIVQECKKTKNADGKSQMRRHTIDFTECREEFALFWRLIVDATEDLSRRRVFLPNPSDIFEGENSFDIYRLGLVGEETMQDELGG